MDPNLGRLAPYPFERLARLRAGVVPPPGLSPIAMTIGEPRHPPPGFVLDALVAALDGVGVYPATAGLPELRRACAAWLERRFGLGAGRVDPETMVLPVNGTREALFAFVQAAVDRGRSPIVAMPNPFYQIYEGAALLAGAQPCYLPTSPGTGWLPDLDAVPESTWARCQLLFICTPGNPSGAVMDHDFLARVLALADRYGFVVASDECYSEIYADESAPPPGLLEASERLGRPGFERCIVFHSLSKRSNLPGLRSGFVAGDPALLEGFRLYRTYHGCALPVHVQRASIAAWSDETHVAENRRLYRAKYDAVMPLLTAVLEVERPAGSFYLWPRVPDGDDERFALGLFARKNVAVLPGRYLGRDAGAGNPGAGRIRISLVPGLGDCLEAARRIRDCIEET
ncbi:MAG: succinyldiaminopimelate transaminase [Steroidobacteraceae bacterium]|jgi:N-succinyldiaminopimelate aminotransferase|nr:succinyldiaminopimelate transaminase [Steroidobacteraceae bacterium]